MPQTSSWVDIESCKWNIFSRTSITCFVFNISLLLYEFTLSTHWWKGTQFWLSWTSIPTWLSTNFWMLLLSQHYRYFFKSQKSWYGQQSCKWNTFLKTSIVAANLLIFAALTYCTTRWWWTRIVSKTQEIDFRNCGIGLKTETLYQAEFSNP